jgi:hypothetical protein
VIPAGRKIFRIKADEGFFFVICIMGVYSHQALDGGRKSFPAKRVNQHQQKYRGH